MRAVDDTKYASSPTMSSGTLELRIEKLKYESDSMSRSLIAFVFVTLTLAASEVTLRAQTVADSLIVHLKSGERVAIALLDIQKITFDSTTASVANEQSQKLLEVSPPYPNPLSRRATIEFSIPSAGNVAVAIFDVKGNPVRKLDVPNAQAGLNHVAWDGLDHRGIPVSGGSYFFEVRFGNAVQMRRMVVIR
jgi:hypothetical protein